jgi:hypothetical protein
VKKFVKDPDARLDYSVDWTPFLTSVADTADTFAWVAPSGLTLADASATGTLHTVVISGGQLHQSYVVTSRVTTAGGRIQDQSFTLEIKET